MTKARRAQREADRTGQASPSEIASMRARIGAQVNAMRGLPADRASRRKYKQAVERHNRTRREIRVPKDATPPDLGHTMIDHLP